MEKHKKGTTIKRATINTWEYMSQDHYKQGKQKSRKTINKPREKLKRKSKNTTTTTKWKPSKGN